MDLKVFYENDNRVEYLNRNEVLSHLAENDKIYEVQLAEPPRYDKIYKHIPLLILDANQFFHNYNFKSLSIFVLIFYKLFMIVAIV